MKNSTHFWVEFLGMGNREWGMGKMWKIPYTQYPKGWGNYPSPPACGWSFPSLSINRICF
ncbi:MAG: hypothetical protein VKL59_19435 [Nostocaceae cyanobacterium]|nr:hypothetical protein [Nostocaceae cyanobacterium]